MKLFKACLMIIFFVFILQCAGISQKGSLQQTQAELKFLTDKLVKIENNIISLNPKLSTADAKRKKKVNALISKELQRAESIKKQIQGKEAEIASLTPPPPPPAAAAPPPAPIKMQLPQAAPAKANNTWFTAGAGLDGGAGAIELGVLHKISAFSASAKFGYGMGKEYSVTVIKVGGTYAFLGQFFAGAGIDLGSYSEKVKNIPGISGTIDKGPHTGFGAYAGMLVNNMVITGGYSTSLGLSLTAEYKF